MTAALDVDIAKIQADLATLAADRATDAAAEAAKLAQLTTLRGQLATAQAQHATDAATNAQLQAQILAMQGAQSPDPAFTRLAWHDEFDGTALDRTKWQASDGIPAGNEHAIRWARNVQVAGGCLVIQPKLETSTAKGVTRQYTSGEVSTAGLFVAQRPFYMETLAALPLATGKSAGMWPAPDWFRALAGAGEIDGCEMFELGVGASDNAVKEQPHGKMTSHIYSNTDTSAGKAGYIAATPIDATAMHYYGTKVDADGSVTTYLDRKLAKSFPASQYPYLGGPAFAGGYITKVTLQIGSTYYGTPDANVDWSQTMRLDYMRCWTPG